MRFALTFNGRNRFQPDVEMMAKISAGQFMADIVALRLGEHLRQSNHVIMRREPGPGHWTPTACSKSRADSSAVMRLVVVPCLSDQRNTRTEHIPLCHAVP